MIRIDDVKRTWEVLSLLDFISQFEIQDWYLNKYDDIKEIQDIYDSKYYSSDEESIIEWLDQDSKFYTIDFIQPQRDEEFWRILEVQKGEDYEMLARENKAFAEYLKLKKYTDVEIGIIANGGKTK